MAIRHLQPDDLAGKVIDVHSHLGVSLKSYACLEYPYAQSVEGLYYRQLAGGVDVNVVFPFSPDLYFRPSSAGRGHGDAGRQSDLARALRSREPIADARGVSAAVPNCSIVSCRSCRSIPGGKLRPRSRPLNNWSGNFPIYGIKILPVFCQTPITKLLEEGRPILDFARARDIPLLLHTTSDLREQYSNARLALEVIERNRDLRFCLAHCIGFHRGLLGTGRGAGQCLGRHVPR